MLPGIPGTEVCRTHPADLQRAGDHGQRQGRRGRQDRRARAGRRRLRHQAVLPPRAGRPDPGGAAPRGRARPGPAPRWRPDRCGWTSSGTWSPSTATEQRLPLKEFELLEMFLRNPGRVLTRGQLIDRVWGSDYVGDTKTLDVHVKRLRAKLEPDPGEPKLPGHRARAGLQARPLRRRIVPARWRVSGEMTPPVPDGRFRAVPQTSGSSPASSHPRKASRLAVDSPRSLRHSHSLRIEEAKPSSRRALKELVGVGQHRAQQPVELVGADRGQRQPGVEVDVAEPVEGEGDAVHPQVALQQPAVDLLVVLVGAPADERVHAQRVPADVEAAPAVCSFRSPGSERRRRPGETPSYSRSRRGGGRGRRCGRVSPARCSSDLGPHLRSRPGR